MKKSQNNEKSTIKGADDDSAPFSAHQIEDACFFNSIRYY